MRIVLPGRIDPGAARPGLARRLDLSGPTMGVQWRAALLAPADLSPERVEGALQAALNGVVAEMSGWETGSTLSRFNRAPAGTRLILPASTHRVVARARHWAELSGGAFDPTLGELVDLWGFGPAGAVTAFPDAARVAAARAAGGWRRVDLDPTTRAVRQPGGLTLDLSGIAKGFGLDVAAQVLGRLGARDYLVEIGGELIGAGVKADGAPWWVDVETPPGVTLPQGPLRIALHGLAVATSGDYRRVAEHGGRRISHTLDPRTGEPVANGVVSATALAANGMDADAIATVLAVLGPEAGMAFAARHGLAAQIVFERDQAVHEVLSPALGDMLG